MGTKRRLAGVRRPPLSALVLGGGGLVLVVVMAVVVVDVFAGDVDREDEWVESSAGFGFA